MFKSGGKKKIQVKGQVGSLKAGAYADIVELDGDPIQDIRQLQNVTFVMKKGELYKIRIQ